MKSDIPKIIKINLIKKMTKVVDTKGSPNIALQVSPATAPKTWCELRIGRENEELLKF